MAGNGTSFASPIVAGMTACLWQAHPNRTNMEIINAIIKSAHLNKRPNDSLGYGLPKFALADLLLSEPKNPEKAEVFAITANPISANSNLYVYAANTDIMNMEVYDIGGRKIAQSKHNLSRETNNQIPISFLRRNAVGTYFLKINIDGQEFVERVIVAE